MGGALGLAVLASLAASRTDDAARGRRERARRRSTAATTLAFLARRALRGPRPRAAAALLLRARCPRKPPPPRRAGPRRGSLAGGSRLSACRTLRTRTTGRGSTSRMTAGQGRRSCSTAASSTRWSSSGASRFRCALQELGRRVPADLRRPSRPRAKRQASRHGLLHDAVTGGGRCRRPRRARASSERTSLVRPTVEGSVSGSASTPPTACCHSSQAASSRMRSNRDGPLARVVSGVLDKTRREGAVAFVEALEEYWEARFPDDFRPVYLAQDGAALSAAAEAMLTLGRHFRPACRPGAFLASSISARGTPTSSSRRGKRPARSRTQSSSPSRDSTTYGAHFMTGRIIPAVLRTFRGASGRTLSA